MEAVLAAWPYPRYETGPGPGLLVKIDADGIRTAGKFVNREFRPVYVADPRTTGSRR